MAGVTTSTKAVTTITAEPDVIMSGKGGGSGVAAATRGCSSSQRGCGVRQTL